VSRTMSEPSSVMDVLVELNPDASPTEISESIVDWLESYLPSIARSIEVPTISPIESKLRALLLKRRKKASRVREEKYWSEREKLVEDLRQLQIRSEDFVAHSSSFNGHPAPAHGDFDSFMFERPSFEEHDFSPGKLTYQIEAISKPDEVEVKPKKVPDTVPPIKKEDLRHRIPRITMDKNIRARIVADPLFSHTLRFIETGLRGMSEPDVQELDFILRTDIEIPTWKAVVLKVHPVSGDFDQKTRLWDRVDDVVRQCIREMMNLNLYVNKLEAIKEINRNLFIEMDLT